LIEAKDSDGDEVADKEERLNEREGERREKTATKMLIMPFCA